MKITKPLVILDIETTGVWIEKDKIIEMALIKYFPDGKKEIYHKRINPGIAIPAIVTELTGIRNEDVREAPVFKAVAGEILQFIGSADLGGFNVERFDLPLMAREFLDAGFKFEWEGRTVYDAQKVYHLNEKRDLAAAYQFYCKKELKGAHTALADTEAAYDILVNQVKKYGEGQEDISVLNKFEYVTLTESYDEDGKFCWWNGKLYPTFGKYRRKASLEDIAKKDRNYLEWILQSEFKDDVKLLIKSVLNGAPLCRK